VNFVFSTGSGSPQTVDVNNVTTDKFFEISTDKDGAKHKVNDVTSTYTGIEPIVATPDRRPNKIYTLDGRQVTTPSRGIYIVNGKKVVVR
jgi:alpha-amylase